MLADTGQETLFLIESASKLVHSKTGRKSCGEASGRMLRLASIKLLGSLSGNTIIWIMVLIAPAALAGTWGDHYKTGAKSLVHTTARSQQRVVGGRSSLTKNVQPPV